LFFAKGRVHGRFTRAHLPNGEIVPVCLQLWSLDSKDAGSAGIAAAPDSTAKKARLVGRMIFAEPVPRFD
jgi:serine/threonine-protein kinase